MPLEYLRKFGSPPFATTMEVQISTAKQDDVVGEDSRDIATPIRSIDRIGVPPAAGEAIPCFPAPRSIYFAPLLSQSTVVSLVQPGCGSGSPNGNQKKERGLKYHRGMGTRDKGQPRKGN